MVMMVICLEEKKGYFLSSAKICFFASLWSLLMSHSIRVAASIWPPVTFTVRPSIAISPIQPILSP